MKVLQIRIEILGYDVVCHACGAGPIRLRANDRTDQSGRLAAWVDAHRDPLAAWVDAHRDPWLVRLILRFNDGPEEFHACQQPLR